jgi:predicted transcriptional regulator
MKRSNTKQNDPRVFATVSVLSDVKREFSEFASERRRNIADIAAAAIKALKMLTREQQDALIEGRELEPSAA